MESNSLSNVIKYRSDYWENLEECYATYPNKIIDNVRLLNVYPAEIFVSFCWEMKKSCLRKYIFGMYYLLC